MGFTTEKLHLLGVLKDSFGCQEVKDVREVETSVTQWLVAKDTYIYQQRMEKRHATWQMSELRHRLGKQDRQYTYKVALWRVSVTTGATETQKFNMCFWTTCHCQLNKNNECRTTMILWHIYVLGNNKTYVSLNGKCPMQHSNVRFLMDFISRKIQLNKS